DSYEDRDWFCVELSDRRRVPVLRHTSGKPASNSRRADRARDDAGLHFHGPCLDRKRPGSDDQRVVRRSYGPSEGPGRPGVAGATPEPGERLSGRRRKKILMIQHGPAIAGESASDTNGVGTSAKPVPASLWRPLRSPTFRNLLIANVVSDVGTFMQNVGAAWLMVSLNAGPM